MVASQPQAPEVGPQAPEFGPFEFCVCRQPLFSRGPLLAHRHFPGPQVAPVWLLAEAPRGNYALFHGPRTAPGP